MGWFQLVRGQVEQQQRQTPGGSGVMIGIKAHRAMLVQVVASALERGCERSGSTGVECVNAFQDEKQMCTVCSIRVQLE